MWEDREDVFQAFECRHGECTRKSNNLKNLHEHMKKKHNLFIEKTDPKRLKTNYCVWFQNHKKINSKTIGDVKNRLRKFYNIQMKIWWYKALVSWNEIEKMHKIVKHHLNLFFILFFYSKKIDIFKILNMRWV